MRLLSILMSNFIRLKGLPWTVTKKDIKYFLKDIKMPNGENSIHLLKNYDGRFSGNALVEVETENDVTESMKYHKQYIGQRFIEIEKSNENELKGLGNKNNKNIENESIDVSSHVIFIRGLSFQIKPNEIKEFFKPLEPKNINLLFNSSGRFDGSAEIEFSNNEDITKALSYDRKYIGNRYIEVSVNKKRHQISNGENFGILMKGIPFSASNQDIENFLKPLVPKKINLYKGDAEIEFSTRDEAFQALDFNKKYMGDRYILISLYRKNVKNQQYNTRRNSFNKEKEINFDDQFKTL